MEQPASMIALIDLFREASLWSPSNMSSLYGLQIVYFGTLSAPRGFVTFCESRVKNEHRDLPSQLEATYDIL